MSPKEQNVSVWVRNVRDFGHVPDQYICKPSLSYHPCAAHFRLLGYFFLNALLSPYPIAIADTYSIMTEDLENHGEGILVVPVSLEYQLYLC